MAKHVLAAFGPFAVVLAFLGLDCDGGPLSVGQRCERNSECDTPLVCRLERCRKECNTTRDCGAGLACVLDSTGVGSCQVPADERCIQQSDCPAPLVCRFEQCVNACEADEDCAAGSVCATDEDGAKACLDPSGRPCVHHVECEAAGQTCALDGRCRDECRNDRDCRFGSSCCPMDFTCRTEAECAAIPPRDAGPRDMGAPDTGEPLADGGTPDAGPPPGTTLVPSVVSCGGDVTCVVHDRGGAGQIVCWGRNDHGQLGRGTISAFEPVPAPVGPLGGEAAAAVGCSADACCATIAAPLAQGEVWCWGAIPDPATGVVSDEPSPVRYDALSDLGFFYPQTPSIQAGTFCVSDLGSGLTGCWGDNGSGQLGDGTTMASGVARIAGDVNEARVGNGFVCGLDMSGVAACRGRNDEGQLGRGTVSAMEATGVVSVAGPFSRVPIYPGRAHACLLDAAGGVFCWGRGAEGQIGDGASTERPTPTAIGTAVDLACGGDMCCASELAGAGVTSCWGTGPLGAAGATTSGVPIDVTRPAGVDALRPVCIGRAHACATDGSTPARLYCWGDNSVGQLGTGAADVGSEVPVHVVPSF